MSLDKTHIMMRAHSIPGKRRYTRKQIDTLVAKRANTLHPFNPRDLPSFLKPTEDRILCIDNVNGVSLLAVFDGHGFEGGFVAGDTRTYVHQWLTDTNALQLQLCNRVEREALIRELFAGINAYCKTGMMARDSFRIIDCNGAVRYHTGQPVRGGTTATITFMFMKDEKKIVHTANVGDSTGYILVTRLDGKTECITTTTSHNANNMADYQDMQRAGGLCRFAYTDNEKKSDDWLPVFSGTADCAVREPVPSTARPTNAKGAYGMYVTSPSTTPTDDIFQVAVTRSIGNFYAPHGYNRVPDQIAHEFDKDEKLFVCIASDGLWDVVPNDEQVLHELKQELESSESIQQTVAKYAFEGSCLFGPMGCDDISAVVTTY